MSDVQRPTGDSYLLVGDNWPCESESAYHAAELNSDALLTAVSAQAESADDAARQTDSDMKGQTADSVSGAYSHLAALLHQQSQDYTSISGWMVDAASEIRKAKKRIVSLVHSGTSEVRTALESEVNGAAVSPSSSELIDKYRADIAAVKTTLESGLDSIGHSLAGDPGASRTPSYVSMSTAPTPEHADPHAAVASYTGTPGAPTPEPQKLPEMPRAATAESPSTPSTPAPTVSPHSANPTLSNLVAGNTSSLGTPSSTSTSSAKPASTSSGTPEGQGAQAHQPNEQHQNAKPPVLPHIPSIPLPDAPAVAESIATAVTSSVGGHQLPTAPSTPAAQAPSSTGFTPGISGTAPMTPASPAGLSPVGGLTPSPVVQTPPASQGTPGTTSPGVQTPSATPSPAPRGPVVDAAWLQRTYGLSPSLDLPKPETTAVPVLFITDMAESEAHLHKILATLRHAFDDAGWGQPMAVGLIRKGFETKTVYVTSDGLSIHPQGVLLPSEVIPLDEIPGTPTAPELSGSLMVSAKLTSLIPRTWEIESVLSTVPGGEASQTSEQYQLLVDAEELLVGNESRGRDDVGDDEALRVFARAALGSAGCGELDVESARIRASRWVGTQPAGYLDSLARWYLSDAAESMSLGRWGEAVWSCEKYMSIKDAEKQAA